MSNQLQIPASALLLRAYRDDDYNFVLGTWLENFRPAPVSQLVTNDVYYVGQKALITRLATPATTVIAANPEDDSQIFGFACGDPAIQGGLLHYIFIKSHYRGMGIGTRLLAALGCSEELIFTHLPKDSRRIFKRLPRAVYNPYLAR